MRKFYLISTLLLSSFISFAQQTTNNQITGNPVLNEELIPVQKGDSFFIKPNIALSQKRPFLTNAFRALGAATAAYGASHAVESRGKNTSAGKAGILPEAGAAIFLTAPQLAKIARHTKTYLQYFVYDKNKKLISTNIVPVTKQVLKKNAGYIPGSKITEDGFVRTMIVGQDRTGINYASPNINVVPAKKDNVEEVVAATLKPAQLESISKLNVATTRPRTITNNKIAKGLIINPAAVKKAKANNKVIKIAKDVQNKTPVKNGTAINKKNENIAAIKIALIKPSPLKQQPQRGIPVFHKVLLYIRRKKSETEEDGTKTDGTSPEEPSTPISQPMEIDPTMDDDDDDADCDVDEDEIDGDGGGGGCGCDDGGDDYTEDDADDSGDGDEEANAQTLPEIIVYPTTSNDKIDWSVYLSDPANYVNLGATVTPTNNTEAPNTGHTIPNLPALSKVDKQVANTCLEGGLQYLELLFGGTISYQTFIANAAQFEIDNGLLPAGTSLATAEFDVTVNGFNVTMAQLDTFIGSQFNTTAVSTYEAAVADLNVGQPISGMLTNSTTTVNGVTTIDAHEVIIIGYDANDSKYQYYDPQTNTTNNYVDSSKVSNLQAVWGAKH